MMLRLQSTAMTGFGRRGRHKRPGKFCPVTVVDYPLVVKVPNSVCFGLYIALESILRNVFGL
jgi:hypothetical protein